MKKIILVVLAVIIAAVVYGLNQFGFFSKEENIRTSANLPKAEAFAEIEVPFTHQAAEGFFPFLGAAVIDIDGDGKEEVFISGSEGQTNAVLSYRDGALVDIASEVGMTTTEASFGALAVDFDNDGDTDLLVGHFSGVWLYENNDGQLSGERLDITLPEKAQPMSITTADINKDGLLDLYIGNFVVPEIFVASTFNDENHAKKNLMLLNKGNKQFEDITEQTGTAGSQNTFHASFVDLDQNGDADLVIANNTGVVEIFKNNGDLTFEKQSFDSGIGYWMGLGVGDFDKDGFQELFFSNIGTSIPEKFTRGDMTEDQALNLEWLILDNDGQWNFKDITADVALTGYGFAWGGVFEDVNYDGDLDLLVGQNYINWPKHKTNKLPGKAFLQVNTNGKSEFYQADALGLENAYYGQSPVMADLNNDGKLDVIWINMAEPAKAFLNQSTNNHLKVVVPDSIVYVGAALQITTDSGVSSTKQIVQGVGYATDQTNNAYFGLGQSDEAITLTVTLANGEVITMTDLSANETIQLPNLQQ